MSTSSRSSLLIVPSKKSLVVSPRAVKNKSAKKISSAKQKIKESNMFKARIRELEDMITGMEADREGLREKIMEGAAKYKEQYGKIVNYSELLVQENRSLT